MTGEIEGLERITLRSVGIDIGTATTHLVFARLVLRRVGSLSARWEVAEREVLFRSPISLTPYRPDGLIDAEQVGAIAENAYRAAGIAPGEVDTGAVLVTGEALKKANARPIVERVARDGGEFVCASAGPSHEAILAAHGSGAVALSTRVGVVLHVDIGGGTAKVARIERGAIVATTSVSVGARLICVDESGELTRLEETGAAYLSGAGMPGARVGATVAPAVVDRAVSQMWDVLSAALTPWSSGVDAVVASGGVAEYVYGAETGSYGDLGPRLGVAVRRGIDALLPGKLAPASERIRATVIGAGEYTVQASGQTTFVSGPDALPARGLKVVPAELELGGSDHDARLRAALARFDQAALGAESALSLTLRGPVDYGGLRALAEAIRDVTAVPKTRPLVVLLDADVAASLGAILRDDLGIGGPLVVVDGIEVGDLDYVDVGRPVGALGILPVTVRSLVFPE